MKVSVIVPTYRREWELKRALCSLSGQEFSDFEIIVVDDNCESDWNKRIQFLISDFWAQYPFIKICYVMNSVRKGSAQSRNEGARKASGEYITFLDDDDEYLAGKIRRQYDFMKDNQLDYSITDLDLYYDNGKLSERRRRSDIQSVDKKSLLEYHLLYHLTGTDTIMMTKAYFEKIGGFPPIDVGDEFYLISRAIENDGKFGYLPACDVRAYVHTGEGGLSSGEGKIAGERQLYQYKKKYFEELSAKRVRYVKMRHYAVLAFAGFRMKNYWCFFLNGMFSFLSAPLQCVKLLIN